MSRHGLKKADLIRLTGLHEGAVNRAVEGNGRAINERTAELVSKVFGLDAGDIAWPCGITDRGRPPLTGHPIITRPIPVQPACPDCYTLLPVSGECSMCAA